MRNSLKNLTLNAATAATLLASCAAPTQTTTVPTGDDFSTVTSKNITHFNVKCGQQAEIKKGDTAQEGRAVIDTGDTQEAIRSKFNALLFKHNDLRSFACIPAAAPAAEWGQSTIVKESENLLDLSAFDKEDQGVFEQNIINTARQDINSVLRVTFKNSAKPEMAYFAVSAYADSTSNLHFHNFEENYRNLESVKAMESAPTQQEVLSLYNDFISEVKANGGKATKAIEDKFFAPKENTEESSEENSTEE